MVSEAYIFPGQGAQYVGMGKDLYEKSPEAKNIFDTADKTLGFSISGLCFEGPQEELKRTDICQVAIFTVSIATLEAFKAVCAHRTVRFVSGLSLGEYTALVAAEVLRFEDALHLVQIRGQFMDEAAEKNPGKMAAVLGLSPDKVRSICKEAGVEIANLNCPGQVVISGKAESIDKAKAHLEEAGASKVVFLEVSGAFHSSLMKEVSVKLAREIERFEFKMPKVRVVSNVTARPQANIDEIKQNLIRQVYSSVLWEDGVRFMSEQGVKKFYEIGPGHVLKGILRKIDPSLEVVNIGKYADMEGE